MPVGQQPFQKILLLPGLNSVSVVATSRKKDYNKRSMSSNRRWDNEMAKKSIRDIAVRGKRVLIRVDFNVPRDKETGEITNDSRIQAALPTLRYLVEEGAKIVIMTHLGRPKGEVNDSLRLDKVARHLEGLLGRKIIKADEAVGPAVEAMVSQMNNGDILLLENVRFYPGETKNDPELSAQLAKLGDIFVNDAFGTAHRAHCSTEGVGHFLPAVAGFLIEKEVNALSGVLNQPEHPFVAIIGGAKVSDKIGVIQTLLEKVDILMIGGGMANTFLQAQGYPMGKSLVEEEKLSLAQELMDKAKALGKQLLLPVDLVVADGFDLPETAVNVPVSQIGSGQMALDIGTETVQLYQAAVAKAKTVIWNGPMGVFEVDAFAQGTNQVAQAVAASAAYSVVGGGDSVAALEKAGLREQIGHISTGGGASLEFLEGKTLPGIDVLLEQ